METSKVVTRAEEFLRTAYHELGIMDQFPSRWDTVKQEIVDTGTWTQTTEEVSHGARMAWRNSNRCIGRLFWKSLKVVDARHVQNANDAFDFLDNHLHYAFNSGEIRSVITIFKQKLPGQDNGPRIWNNQLLSFAGQTKEDGSILGDPLRLHETKWFTARGWHFQGTAFDLLPVAMQWPDQEVCVRQLSLPEKMIVPLEHPDHPWFSALGLQWYGLPVISDMSLEIGGVKYTAAPFNGWYMGTEIGSRNLCDAHRYDIMPRVAQAMGLDTSSNWSLWKDRVLVEVNRAVLFSFHKQGIKISNHHDSAMQFLHFEDTETSKGRSITADWSWIVPPLSGSATAVFHKSYDNTVLDPNFFYQESPFPSQRKNKTGCPFHQS